MNLLTVLVIVAILLLGGTLAMVYVLWRKLQQPAAPQDTQGMMLLQNQLAELTRAMDSKLGEGTKTMADFMSTQSDQGQRLMSTITKQVQDQLIKIAEGVAKTEESTKQVFTLAEQLQNLEKVLTHQKQRGNLGEASLELILGNILPPTAYKMQYEFPGGETVDAVVITKEGVIPVDAKFSLENYNRLINAIDATQREELEKAFKNDLKLRIDECAKYVRPKDGTLPFAFMYIPAEAIYYDLLINEVGAVKVNTRNLIDYAYNEKKVIIVSPTTFAAYLQSVLYGFVLHTADGDFDIASWWRVVAGIFENCLKDEFHAWTIYVDHCLGIGTLDGEEDVLLVEAVFDWVSYRLDEVAKLDWLIGVGGAGLIVQIGHLDQGAGQ